jgi:hypothetical protein
MSHYFIGLFDASMGDPVPVKDGAEIVSCYADAKGAVSRTVDTFVKSLLDTGVVTDMQVTTLPTDAGHYEVSIEYTVRDEDFVYAFIVSARRPKRHTK